MLENEWSDQDFHHGEVQVIGKRGRRITVGNACGRYIRQVTYESKFEFENTCYKCVQWMCSTVFRLRAKGGV